MKTLWLLRHAKAVAHGTMPDHERTLEPRGQRDATRLGRHWLERHGRPDVIVASPAARALATARLFAEAVGYGLEGIRIDARIYESSPRILLDIVEATDDAFDGLMLVGHNPEFTELAHRFDPDITNMPTCAVATLQFDVETWGALHKAKPSRSRLEHP
jgi:phosphohistidine phosphatase